MTRGLLQAPTPSGPPRPPQGCARVHSVSELRAEPHAVGSAGAAGNKNASRSQCPRTVSGEAGGHHAQPPWKDFEGSQGERGGCTGGETEAQTRSYSLWEMRQGDAERGRSPVSHFIRVPPIPDRPPGPAARSARTGRLPARLWLWHLCSRPVPSSAFSWDCQGWRRQLLVLRDQM